MAWLPGYSKRKLLTLTGGASGAQTDFQLIIAVSYEAAMQGDFDDIRFTQANGTTLVDAWAEVIVADTSATVWVEFPSTPANTVEQTYYMYYGNGLAASYWDIETTFVFGDDFPGASLDLTKWDVDVGSPVVSGGVVTLSGQTEAIWSDNSFGPTDIAFRSRVQMGETDKKHEIGLTNSPNTASNSKISANDASLFGTQIFSNGSLYTNINDGSGVPTQNAEYAYNTDYHIYDFTFLAGSCKFYDDDVEKREYGAALPTAAMPIWFSLRDNTGGSVIVDWAIIRKYASGPPTYAFGSEESAPTGGRKSAFYGPFIGPLGGPI